MFKDNQLLFKDVRPLLKGGKLLRESIQNWLYLISLVEGRNIWYQSGFIGNVPEALQIRFPIYVGYLESEVLCQYLPLKSVE